MLGVTTISLCTIDIFGKFVLKKGGGSIFPRTDLKQGQKVVNKNVS